MNYVVEAPPDLDGPKIHALGVLLAVFSFLTFFLDLPALIWHLKRKNFAVVSLVFWIMLQNAVSFINVMIWPNDQSLLNYQGVGLCDIEVKLQIGHSIATQCCLVAIMRNLANIFDTSRRIPNPSPAQKRRALIIDMSICWLPPIFLMILHVIVQPARYLLRTVSGCNTVLDTSWLAIFLIVIWPLVFAVYDTYYAILLIARLVRYKHELRSILETANTTKTRFMRLFIMSVVLVALSLPLTAFVFISNINVSHQPYSWSTVHAPGWSKTVYLVPYLNQVFFDRWFAMANGILAFAFFGLSADAVQLYRSSLSWIGLPKMLSAIKKSSFRAADHESDSVSGLCGKDIELSHKSGFICTEAMTPSSEKVSK